MTEGQQPTSETEVTAEAIAAAAGEHRSSVNGWGAESVDDPFAESPELVLGAAFAGGFLLARLVRRLAR